MYIRKNVTMPSSVTEIKKNAFYNCSSLERIIIPSSVTEIESYAFKSCKSLKNVTFNIPSALHSIESFAFDGCLSLKNVFLPSATVLIGENSFPSKTEIVFIPSPELVDGNYGSYSFNLPPSRVDSKCLIY